MRIIYLAWLYGVVFHTSAELFPNLCSKEDATSWNLYMKMDLIKLNVYQCIPVNGTCSQTFEINCTLTEYSEQAATICKNSSRYNKDEERSSLCKCRGLNVGSGQPIGLKLFKATANTAQNTIVLDDYYNTKLAKYSNGNSTNGTHVFVWDLVKNGSCQNLTPINTTGFIRYILISSNNSRKYLILKGDDNYAVEVKERGKKCMTVAQIPYGSILVSKRAKTAIDRNGSVQHLQIYKEHLIEQRHAYDILMQDCLISELDYKCWLILYVVMVLSCYVVLQLAVVAYSSMMNCATFRSPCPRLQGNINRLLLKKIEDSEYARTVERGGSKANEVDKYEEGKEDACIYEKGKEDTYEYVTSDYEINDLYGKNKAGK